ncbi:hypothetical protein CEXT_136211 [Caerostris extrusa]|uniref:Uncharacterized protein n=1 Tax=Caerostris extrusa TaxID=172846 RepID=A0AAV4VIX2_CAEEX|nr:hypothetical protein CEXT_136211 [Caerostris extrusa]
MQHPYQTDRVLKLLSFCAINNTLHVTFFERGWMFLRYFHRIPYLRGKGIDRISRGLWVKFASSVLLFGFVGTVGFLLTFFLFLDCVRMVNRKGKNLS